MLATKTGTAGLALSAVISMIVAKAAVAALTGNISVTAQATLASLISVGFSLF